MNNSQQPTRPAQPMGQQPQGGYPQSPATPYTQPQPQSGYYAQPQPTYAPPMYPQGQMYRPRANRKGICIPALLGVISGVISIALAIISFVFGSEKSRRYTSYKSYGGDAYTGIQHAAADVSNNVSDVICAVGHGMAVLLFVLGLMLISYFAGNLKGKGEK